MQHFDDFFTEVFFEFYQIDIILLFHFTVYIDEEQAEKIIKVIAYEFEEEEG
jgi:hypothetical protein